jgi:pimeloyl-ACP methyl ester carboxylesterase
VSQTTSRGARAPVRKGYVDARDGQLHYRVAGAGPGEPIVFLHQTASSSQMYERLMAALAGDYRMLALDTPGFGQSFAPPVRPTIGYYVEVFAEALTALGVTAFHLFGHHTGASIACEMAATLPDRVRSLMLGGPVHMDDAERRRWLAERVQPMVIREDGSHLAQIWERVRSGHPGSAAALCHREVVDNLAAGERYHEAYQAVFTQDFPALLARVRCPILMLCGDGDVLMPYFDAARRARPDARCVALQGGGYVVDEAPEVVAAEIRAFLARQ